MKAALFPSKRSDGEVIHPTNGWQPAHAGTELQYQVFGTENSDTYLRRLK